MLQRCTFFLFIFAVFIYAPPIVWGQGQETQLSPLEQSWCSQGFGSRLGSCAFSSPHAACENSAENFYPNRQFPPLVSVGVSSNRTSASCNVTRTSAQGLFLGTPRATRSCPSGSSRSGGQCSPVTEQICNDCTSGGSRSMSGNPIALLSGIKFEKTTDFVSDDGRLMFARTYASRSYGTLNNESVGVLGRGWSVDI